MKMRITVVSFLASALAALAQGIFVVPNGLGNVEGNSSSTALFGTSFFRVVQVFSASEFGLTPGSSGLVTSVSFRFDGSTAQSFSGIWPGAAIGLSTTLRSPDSLSPVFNDNHGADGVNVYNSGAGFFISAVNTTAFPRTFEVVIPFNTPFWYDPSKGNLAMDVITGSGGTSLILDGQDTFGDGVGRVFGPGGGFNGSVDSFGFATRFGMTVVPEPSSMLLFGLGIAFFLAFFKESLSRAKVGTK